MKTCVNCKLILILFVVSLFACTSSLKKDHFFVKKAVFEEGVSLDTKIKQAAHVIPTKQQLEWQKLEMTAFVHFTINTFTGMEWGHGNESPELFNPTELDAKQWVKTLKDGGMKLVILTCKHHDGFCLWPTKTTTHSVVSSPWKDGKGDVVKELKEACEEYGMKFGIYLSPWDRNAACYGGSSYNAFFLKQLSELLTWYGKVDEVWFDGACGEGPNGKKQVYDWDAYYQKIHELQPDAVVAVMGEDVRWVGTESGYGRESEWSVTALAPGGKVAMNEINRHLNIQSTTTDLGSRAMIDKASNLFWYPAEVDVSIRPGWFYHESENDQIKSLAKMVDIYFNSVGRNALLLLNIPPDKRGLIHENDVARLQEFKAYIDSTFDRNILEGAISNSGVNANKAIDDQYDTSWNVDEMPTSVEFTLSEEESFNVLMLQEQIALGQRVEKFRVEVMLDGQWKEIVSSTTIGYKKLMRFKKVKTNKVRLTILECRDGAHICNFGLFESPEILSDPIILRDKEGLVSLSTESPNLVMTYTLDGSDPTKSSVIYDEPFLLPKGGLVKACAFTNDFKDISNMITEQFDICPAKWQVISYSDQVNSFPASNAIDGNVQTMWHSHWDNNVLSHPHFIAVDLGEPIEIKGFSYIPRAGTNKSGTVLKYSFYVSVDGENWICLKNKGEFSNMRNHPIKQFVRFKTSYMARYFKFESISGIYNEDWISVGELGLLTR